MEGDLAASSGVLLSRTPLRTSLIGGGTDLPAFYSQHEGAVISAAIDKYVYVLVKASFEGHVRVRYSRVETVEHANQLEHDLVREAMRKVGITTAIETDTLGDLPARGTGLGSSSSITVGLLNVLYHYKNDPRPPETLAKEACEIEIDVLGRPIGKQDQYIAALGGIRKITFHRDGTVTHYPLLMQEDTRRRLNACLSLYYTGLSGSGDPVLERLRKNRDSRHDELRQLKKLVEELEGALTDGYPDAVGEILHQSWGFKKRLAEGVSNPLIDGMYEAARRAGAIGGKISGAGGRGFLLLYVPPKNHSSVRSALRGYRQIPVNLEPDGTQILLDLKHPKATTAS